MSNRVVLIQVWFGPIPDYFWFHYETTKNLIGYDFLFFTDQDLILDSPNYKVIKTNKEKIEKLVSDSTGVQIEIKSNKKTCDLKACYGDIFREYVDGYDYYGAYDIDTLFGDVYNFTKDFYGEYDIITIADEIYHNRLGGPFVIFKNDSKLSKEYLSKEFIECFNNSEVECFEETYLNAKLKDKYKIKYIYSQNCETDNGGKIGYECLWRGGKVYFNNKEIFICHFFRKNFTKLYKFGNNIVAKYDKVLVDDFYWVVSFTENYKELFYNLLKSIKRYSNRKCIIYSINFDYELPIIDCVNEQFIVRRIDIPEGSKDIRGRDNNIISSKPLINLDVIYHFPNKKFVTIDSDIYFTVNSDDIKKYFDKLENYPLINSHIHDVIYLNNIKSDEEWTSPLHLLLDEMGVENFVVPRRKTNVVIFDERSSWFFEEQMNLYEKYKGTKPGILSLHDEDTANAILSKYSMNKSLPLLDIEEVSDIDMEVFFKYSYHMTPISPHVILPKTENDVLFFHGIKSQKHYDEICIKYNHRKIECEEFLIKYDGLNLLFEKNSFLNTKTIPNVVDFVIYNTKLEKVFSLINQQINRFFLFYIKNLFLPTGNYTIKILSSNDGTCIFRDILRVP